MSSAFYQHIQTQIEEVKNEGLYKSERIITSAQKAAVSISTGEEVLNFCANNYLGLANHPDLIESAKEGMDQHGFGMASVRFICGTQDSHKVLEQKLSTFLGKEDTILYTSCFDANAGLFETILGKEDAIISDALNHASIIDGVRLCKAMRFRYANNNMEELEQQLIAAKEAGARHTLIVTDGVFSMDGVVANLPAICDLAEKYDALVMVDDSHAVGFMGENGAGTHEYHNVIDRIDIITGTLGKAMGGASGGYTSGKKEVIDWLRQRSRPYLFSNSVAPAIVSASIRVLDLLAESGDLRTRLWENAEHFRARMTEAGFTLAGADHAIIPIMLGDAKVAAEFAERALAKGIYVVGFSFPVVPKGQARIRTQMSAAHSKEQLDKAIDAFIEVGRDMGIIK
ncbi:2-amino-3-ketobutyrate coenzyme A ligase [Vibrio nigripulchritudo ATCC 27043]|uniref:glycine C-acetyltransferase n=1 Tax=Vibrio nigripulchritudo TaxID=28173 RepID=UPI00021C1FF9|nr:glycine C-acetyltransferase [Vibrio nigripulchritudo]EGU50945.1 2-amino-3-ketobutyrate coenzyme A ligase [Vibrio nigripulchritudo ATCC 27043]BCL72836.1 2-amino-3-ketobutyrate coenzyme A ligase [Vibrio nigripulchritudo]BDU34200.1 2-amino-3-ketobutyrate coenzyme A ligase [Vibrio nigripulchritudo]CCN72813.1 2-amino-3-ketobutyrate coenzyme A ligase [Vibrio nigripulchritudo SFn118]